MNEQIRASIDATIAEIAANPMARIATDEANEAYEIVRRLERQIARQRATQPAGAAE